MKPEFSTLVDILRWRAAHQGDQKAYTFLADGDAEENSVTYCELDRQARAVGAWLQSSGAVGERVLLLFDRLSSSGMPEAGDEVVVTGIVEYFGGQEARFVGQVDVIASATPARPN